MKALLFAEKESNVVESFRDLEKSEICLIPDCAETKMICQSILDTERWANWIDSSGKSMPPPDFYNDHEKMMLEVMRVDDHGFKKKGKIINQSLAREHMVERELREAGILDQFPNLKSIIINADSGLPTEEDHNYCFYYDNFRRTLKHHKSKIGNYRVNHPGYKTIFFIFDESTAYVQVENVPDRIRERMLMKGQAHLWFADKRFVEAFQSGEIDYLIWYTPYKLIQSVGSAPQLPVACVFDCKMIDFNLIDYDPIHMVSSEV